MTRVVALILTLLTGFSGLVYEVTWQKYVATLLGSHSEAAAAVLGIFLAGLSLGYSLFGRLTRRLVDRARAEGRPLRLLLVYGCVEAGIGLYALAFPLLFETVRSVSYAVPHGVGGLGFAFDVLLVALLLGPPTVLMGGTIPLLTQALSRGLDDATRFHALVYGFNTAGAFLGALAAAFVLVPQLGLAGTLLWMGLVNLGAGAVFGVLGFRGVELAGGEGAADLPARADGINAYALVALLTGFSVMAIQTVVIRLGGLSLGSSEFTFATVVAVFVLCIAIGSFLVSLFPRLPSRYLALNQCGLVGLLFVIYIPIEEAPYWAHVLRLQFGHTTADFIPYYLASFLGFLAIVGPAAILSGAVLPLLFHHLRREVGDLGSVAGKIYSWNTVGSLLGALLGGYALLFFVDLHHVFRIAIAALAVSAAILVVRLNPQVGRITAVGGLVVTLGALMLLPAWNPDYLNLGLFRMRSERPGSFEGIDAMVQHHLHGRGVRISHHDDDPTATVAVADSVAGQRVVGRSILSNGKSDGGTQGDYPTMGLAAVIPALLTEKVEKAFVIGYGTGVSVGELAAIPGIQRVVVAEISPAVVEFAPLFDFANQQASQQPVVEIIRSDAYRALMRSDESFDIILSEPSNPWVTGVEMLYSREFLTAARARMSPGGVYLQWYHQYETDATAVALVLRTFSSVFDRIAVWHGLGPDLFIMGFNDSDFTPSPASILDRIASAQLKPALARSDIHSMGALMAHELLPAGVVGEAQLQGPLHTLYRPLLNHVAASAFFRGAAGWLPPTRNAEMARVGRQNSLLGHYLGSQSGERRGRARKVAAQEACTHRKDTCLAALARWYYEDPESEDLAELIGRVEEPGKRFGGAIDPQLIRDLAQFYGKREQDDTPVPLESVKKAIIRFRRFNQHAYPFNPYKLVSLASRCQAPPGQEASCARELERARAHLPSKNPAHQPH